MEELLSTFVRSIFVDNMIFAYYLGMCSFVAVSKNVKTALGLGIAVTFVLLCTLPINYMLENYVLKEGALSWLGPDFANVNLSFLAFIIFIAVIASFVQLVEMVIEKFSPSLYASLGISPSPPHPGPSSHCKARCFLSHWGHTRQYSLKLMSFEMHSEANWRFASQACIQLVVRCLVWVLGNRIPLISKNTAEPSLQPPTVFILMNVLLKGGGCFVFCFALVELGIKLRAL